MFIWKTLTFHLWQALEFSLRPPSIVARSRSISKLDDETSVVVEADLHFKRDSGREVLPPPLSVNISNSITVSAEVIPTQEAQNGTGQSARHLERHLTGVYRV
jgi:hypothetical protein